MRITKMRYHWILIMFSLTILVWCTNCEKPLPNSGAVERGALQASTKNSSDKSVREDQVSIPKSQETGNDKIDDPVQKSANNDKISNSDQKPVNLETTGQSMKAIDHASKAGKYLFACFYRSDDEQTKQMRESLDKAMKKVADKADSVAINITDSSEAGIVSKYGLDRAPMPLVLAISPRGAITWSSQKTVEEAQLTEALVSPGLEKVLSALQQRKIVLLSIQNEKTKNKDAAMIGVRDFASDNRYNKFTELVTIDPAEQAEAKFIGQLKIEPKIDEAMTVFLVPPGSVIAVLKGATDKKMLEDALKKGASNCKPGGSSGCCPPKK